MFKKSYSTRSWLATTCHGEEPAPKRSARCGATACPEPDEGNPYTSLAPQGDTLPVSNMLSPLISLR
jgi:hypothetical protein